MSSYDMTDSDGDNSFFCYPTIPIQLDVDSVCYSFRSATDRLPTYNFFGFTFWLNEPELAERKE